MIWKTLVPFCNKKRLIFLANSSFTKNLLYCIYGTKIPIFILYPPCETKKYSKNIDLNDKKNIVIIVSRFSQGKRLELIPEIVRRVKRWNFALVGSTFNKSGEILKSINKKIIEYKIQDRLNIFPNIPFIQLKKLLSESKVYLHLMKNEPFGMSTIEAMASGCVPIIHMSGGGWHDIFMEKQGYYGYAYKKYSDIINYLKLLEDNETYKRLANRSKNRALDFDESMFNKKFIYYINKFTNNKFYSKKS
jgi:glycosyltransferase involved in cell wall biosynthesis